MGRGLQGMPIQMLNGNYNVQDLYMQRDGSYALGCPCQESQGIAGAADYDVIVIGGKQYSANAIVDSTIIATRDTKVYTNTSDWKVYTTIKAGNPIGKVYSYIKASQPGAGGRSWLQFDYAYNKSFYAPNESVPPPTNVPTLEEELKQEELERLKNENPIEYYLRTYGTKILIGGAAVFVAVTFGKEILRHFLNKSSGSKSESKSATPALSGVKRKTKSKK